MSSSVHEISIEKPFIEEIKEIIKDKAPIEIKDRVMLIDENHPDYNFFDRRLTNCRINAC